MFRNTGRARPLRQPTTPRPGSARRSGRRHSKQHPVSRSAPVFLEFRTLLRQKLSLCRIVHRHQPAPRIDPVHHNIMQLPLPRRPQRHNQRPPLPELRLQIAPPPAECEDMKTMLAQICTHRRRRDAVFRRHIQAAAGSLRRRSPLLQPVPAAAPSTASPSRAMPPHNPRVADAQTARRSTPPAEPAPPQRRQPGATS